jgi:NAD(P)-dependent dehydrogenase (short-subunit alcohol dehydrogenase family)
MSDAQAKLGVVIGGGNGIGEACCRLMAQRGWRVAVVDLVEQAAQKVAAEIGGRAYVVDISNLAAVEQLATDIEYAQGPTHALVVSAGISQERFTPAELPIDLWHKVIDVNLGGTFNADRTFGTLMARRGRGAIVNIASTASYGSQPLHAYGPAKAAVINMTKNLATQWGRSGVRVNSVSPGATLVARVLARKPGRYAVDIDNQMALGRRIQPSEIAEGVEFLISDRASAITGTDLLIDAGMLAAAGWGIYGGVPPAEGTPAAGA